MAYLRPFYRVTWKFAINGTDEVAETGVSVAYGDSTALVPLSDTELTGLRTAMSTLLTNMGVNNWASYSRLQSVKVARVGTDGHYLDDPQEQEYSPFEQGTGTTVTPQSTVVLSLRSGQTLGKGNYGRMYIPHFGVPSGGSPYVSSQFPEAWANAGAEFIGSVNAEFDGGAVAAVVRIMGQGSTGPTDKPVTVVGAGRVIDTQRRRRNRLTEEYEFTTV